MRGDDDVVGVDCVSGVVGAGLIVEVVGGHCGTQGFVYGAARCVAEGCFDVCGGNGEGGIRDVGLVDELADVALDLRGANFNQSVLKTTGAASIDRSTVTILAKSATTAGNLIAITPPLPTGATYATSVTPNSQSTVWVTGKTVANLTVTASANTTVDITLTRNT